MTKRHRAHVSQNTRLNSNACSNCCLELLTDPLGMARVSPKVTAHTFTPVWRVPIPWKQSISWMRASETLLKFVAYGLASNLATSETLATQLSSASFLGTCRRWEMDGITLEWLNGLNYNALQCIGVLCVCSVFLIFHRRTKH